MASSSSASVVTSAVRRRLVSSSSSSSSPSTGQRFISNFGSGGGTGAPSATVNFGIGVDRSYLGRRRADKVRMDEVNHHDETTKKVPQKSGGG